MTTEKTLIAGFGNLLRGDDGFGVEVVRRLDASPLPAQVQTMDVGIGGMHFVLRLLERFEVVIVVDALEHGKAPGTLYMFKPSVAEIGLDGEVGIDPHFAEPARALTFAKALGILPEQVTVLGCEPACCQLGQQLSPPVQLAVEHAVHTLRDLVGADGSVSIATPVAGQGEPG